MRVDSDWILCSSVELVTDNPPQGLLPREPRSAASHRVVEHHVLLGQLQQHGIVEELADTDVLAQTLRTKKKGKGSAALQPPESRGSLRSLTD